MGLGFRNPTPCKNPSAKVLAQHGPGADDCATRLQEIQEVWTYIYIYIYMSICFGFRVFRV